MCMTIKPTAVPYARPPALDGAQHALLKTVAGRPDHTAGGKRRRHLWELGSNAHCPVMGVCVTLDELRRWMGKAGLQHEGRSDYELHLIAVNECRRRTPLAEGVEKSLEQRCRAEIQAFKACKSESAVQNQWRQAARQTDWGNALWAVLTHPHCSFVLEHEVLGEVHMLQHQVGMCTRVDQKQWAQTQQALAVAQKEVEGLKARLQAQTRVWHEKSEAQVQAWQKARDAHLAESARHERTAAELQQLRHTVVDLDARVQLQTEAAQLRDKVAELERALKRREEEGARGSTVPLRKNSVERIQPCPARGDETWQTLRGADQGLPCADWRQRTVLCVGGRVAQVPAYREAVETRGAEFLYHDGGEENNLNQLVGTLAAADLVICQVGCISHNAYWRVKEHCKKTGTPCAFVETPSKSALERALRAMEQTQAD